MQLTPIGHVHARGRGFRIDVAPALRGALKGLECFDYAHVLYWLHGLDAPEPRDSGADDEGEQLQLGGVDAGAFQRLFIHPDRALRRAEAGAGQKPEE